MLFTLTLFLVFERIFLVDCDLLFKSRYERKSHELLKKLPLSPSIKEDKFLQKLDHFNPTDTRTWKQLFYTETSFYSKGGPAYLWISGEGSASPGWLSGGYWQEHGRKNRAMFFVIEHRFYGVSQPFSDTSTDNLRYLSTPQALADLATFIVSMNKKHELPEDTKWIVFGGSYAGNLAAWMRLKYPHLVHGAVASSAPVLAQLNFPEYFDVVGNALADYKKQCKDDIAKANKDLEKKVQTRKGRKEIGEIFKLCDPLKGNKLDASYFLSNMADYFAGTVQYDHNRGDIKRACDKMLEDAKNSNAVKRYSNVMNMFLESYGQSCLYTNFTEFTEDLKKTDFVSSANTYRPWFYQTCTEYGYYQISRTTDYLFSKRISIDFYEAMCTKVFKTLFKKPFIQEAVDFTNQFFGGIDINSPRIVSVHGLVDPWHPLGVLSSKKTKNIDVVLIKGASHCNDLKFPSGTDPEELKNARTKIKNLLDAWLKQGKY